MVLGVVITIFKPFLFLWAGLNLIDDLALVIRMGRLAASVVPYPGKSRKGPQDMCGVCDDVIEDLMAGAEGISVIPCKATCLGIKECVNMCEHVKEVSQTSTEFPCVAAGFCDPMDTGYMDVADTPAGDLDQFCRGGAFFSCQPKQYCRRRREGLKFKCELRPGIGRWNGMKNMAAQHTVSLVEGLKNQQHCGEKGAGPFCIARPTGTGIFAEWMGHFISLVIGGYKSIVAIESPGGGDDRQWLTFWLILSIFLFLEQFCARIVLSNLSYYYEFKLVALVWLVWRQGADTCYRKLRSILERWAGNLIPSEDAAAEKWIEIFRKTGGRVVERALRAQTTESFMRKKSKYKPDHYWKYDRDSSFLEMDPTQQLFELSKFILSPDGSKQLQQSTSLSEQKKSILIERAAQVVSFQPRFLNLTLMGSIEGPLGELPPMDSNGLADGYVKCRIVPAEGNPYPERAITSRTYYRSLSPQWNQEIEIPLRGGQLDDDGFFCIDEAIESTHLLIKVYDADVGWWGIVYNFFRTCLVGGVILFLAAYVEGATDNMTEERISQLFRGTVFVSIGYLTSYIMAVFRRSDDEKIGICKVPLGILLDQDEHTLQLTLYPDPKNNKWQVSGSNRIEKPKCNKVGGYGIIRVKLRLSEN